MMELQRNSRASPEHADSRIPNASWVASEFDWSEHLVNIQKEAVGVHSLSFSRRFDSNLPKHSIYVSYRYMALGDLRLSPIRHPAERPRRNPKMVGILKVVKTCPGLRLSR